MVTWRRARTVLLSAQVIPEDGEPEVVFCLDESGPPNLRPRPGRQWAGRGGRHKDHDRGSGPDGGRPTPARTG